MNTNANMSVESPSEGLFCLTLNAGAVRYVLLWAICGMQHPDLN
jgi:hypothetical protein